MSDVIGRAVIEIGADASPFEREANQSVRPGLQSVGNAFSGMGSQLTAAGGALTKGITVPAVGAAAAAAGITASLGWSRLTSIDTAQGQLRGLGYEGEDVERITNQLTSDLEGGMMDLGTATSAAATAMAAGVDEGDELTRYIQTLDGAAVASTGSVDEMAQVFGRVTDQGVLTRQEFDIISNRMAGFSSAVQDHMGISSEAMYDMLRNGEITSEDFLDIMEDFSGEMATEHAKTWQGMVENVKNWVGILGAELLGGVFEDSKLAIEDFLDLLSSDEALEWASEMGQTIGDAFQDLIQWVQDAIDWWTNLDGETQKLIGTIAGIAVAAGPVLLVFGKILSTIGGLITFFTTMGTHLSTLANAFGLTSGPGGAGGLLRVFTRFAGPIGLAITAILAMWDHSEGFRQAIMDLGQSVWDGAQQIWNALQPVLENIGELFMSLGGDGPLGILVGYIMDVLEPVFIGAVEAIQIAWETVVDVIVAVLGIFEGALDVIIGLFTGDWEQVWSGVGQIFSSIWDGIVAVFTGAWDLIVTVFSTMFNVFSTAFQSGLEIVSNIWSSVWEWISEFFSGVWEGITEFFRSTWEGITEWFSGALETISEIWSSVWEGISSFFSSVWETISNAISAAWGFVTDFIQSGLDLVQSIWSSAWEAVRSVVDAVWQGIVSLVQGAISGVQSVISSVLSAISSLWSSIWGTVSSVASSIWSGIVSAISGFINSISSTISSVMSAISSTISSIMSGISSTISSIWSGIVSAISGFMSSISSTISSIWNSIISAISGFMSSISSSISAAWDGVVSTVSTAVSEVLSSVTSTFGEVVSFVADIPSRLLSALGDLGSLFLDAGSSLIGGLVDGITGAFGSARDAISDGLGGLRNLLPFSPAKEGPFSGRGYTLYSGQALMEDFGKGIEDQERSLTDSMRGVAQSAQDAFKVEPDVGMPTAESLSGGLLGRGAVTAPRTPGRRSDSRTASPDGTSGGGGMVVQGPLITVERMTVDNDQRVKQIAQELHTRAMRRDRSHGRNTLRGATE